MAAVSDAQNQANLGSAAGLAAANLGLDPTQASDWTTAQKIAYAQGISSIVQQYPNNFNAQTLQVAGIVGQANAQDIGTVDDTSFDWDQFGTDLEDNAVAAAGDVAALGTGALNAINSVGGAITNLGTAVGNAASVTTWALPAAAILLLFLLARNTNNRIVGNKFLK